MTECPCEAIKRRWLYKNNPDEAKALSILVPEQFDRVNEYYEGGIKVYVLSCKDCGKMIQVPHI